MLNKKDLDNIKPFIPDETTAEYILKWYSSFSDDKKLKDEPYRELGNKTLATFWDKSRDNYDVIVPARIKSDWKRSVKSTLTRDKANVFISRLARKIFLPQILAQNKDQQIDQVVSKTFRSLLEWWEYLSKGYRVFCDAVHRNVIDGTIHIQVDVQNGKEVKTVIPNEEIFIPNFYQPDIQKQYRVERVQKTTYDEAKMIFGDEEMFEYVRPGNIDNWQTNDNVKKNCNAGVLSEDQVQIMYVWGHGGYDNKNNPKPKHFNVFINGIPIYDIENTLPYKHNKYNLAKTVFEKTSDTEFYWGNSLPNKLLQHQEYKDAFRTIVLNKAILNLLKPLLNKSGEHIDEDVIAPSKITETNGEKGDIFAIEGVSDPITANDLNIEALVDREADAGSMAPESAGQAGTEGKKTLGEIQLRDTRQSELMELFGISMSFLVEDMAELSVSNIIQFMLKEDIDKIVDGNDILFKKSIDIPDQKLNGGDMGTMGLKFMAKEKQPTSLQVLQEEENEFKRTGVKTEFKYIDPDYIKDFKFFFKIVVNPVSRPSEAMERILTMENYQVGYLNNPNIDQKEATRSIIRANRDDEERLLAKTLPAPTQAPNQGSTQSAGKVKQSTKPNKPQV